MADDAPGVTPPVTSPPAAPDDARARIAEARAAIGENAENDYILSPTAHASAYRTAAPVLAALLDDEEIAAAARAYATSDAEANAGRARFEAAAKRARDLVLAAAAIAMALLIAGGVEAPLGQSVTKWIVGACSLGALVTSAYATLEIQKIRRGELLQRWMTARAEAETARIAYFELVTRREFGQPLLQLEYFRRYQLDVQRAFYRVRSKQHGDKADAILGSSQQATALGGIVTGAAGLLAALTGYPWVASFAAIGMLAQAYAARQENVEATFQLRRNAERYARTSRALEKLDGELGRVRRAVAATQPDVLTGFVAAVHEQVSAEHRQWIEDMTKATEAVSRLEERLKEYEASAKPTPEPGI